MGVGEYRFEAVEVAVAVHAGIAGAPGRAGVLFIEGRAVVVAGAAAGFRLSAKGDEM